MLTEKRFLCEWKFHRQTRPQIFHSVTVNFPLQTEGFAERAAEKQKKIFGALMATTNTNSMKRDVNKNFWMKKCYQRMCFMPTHKDGLSGSLLLLSLLGFLLSMCKRKPFGDGFLIARKGRWGRLRATVIERTVILWNIHRLCNIST